MVKLDSGWYKLKFRNYTLNEATFKAIASTLPFLVNVVEVEFENNQMSDHMGAIIALGCFMSPSVNKIRIRNNILKGSFVASMNTCVRQFPTKIQALSFPDSFHFPEHTEKFCRGLNLYK